MVAQAFLLLIGFYVALNALRVLTAHVFSSPPEKVLLRQYLAHVLGLHYNTFLVWTRMSAELRTMTEDATWTVSNPFRNKLENGNFQRALTHAVSSFLSVFS